MNDKTAKNDLLKKEYLDSLNKINPAVKSFPHLKYFLDTEYARAVKKASPKVVVLGTSVPEELIYASGAEPYFLTGGSLASTDWSDDDVPRDTDPVSRSILGYIHRPEVTDFSGSLFIIPITNDSMRKIAYQLKAEGRKLYLLDIPPDKADEMAIKKVQRQILDMTEMIAGHVNSHLTRSSIISAVKYISKARKALTAFNDAACERPDLFPDAARLLVHDSYYRTNNIGEWTSRLQILTADILRMKRRFPYMRATRPDIITMGSPVIFPNYKIPFLINDVGLNLTYYVDSAFLKQFLVFEKKELHGGKIKLIRMITSRWYENDASPAYIRNDSTKRYISWLIRNKGAEGVVYHVLKGQIEYDFELEAFEKQFSEAGIPVFRLETDYQYQDIEQLRIRLEAFSEMLTQNRYKGVKQAR